MTFVGETSVKFPESPFNINTQCNEGTDTPGSLFMSPEAEERFEQRLSQRKMATSFMGNNLTNISETSNDSEEDVQDRQNEAQGNEFNDIEEVWEEEDCEEDQNAASLGNASNATNVGNATCTNIITALSFFIL